MITATLQVRSSSGFSRRPLVSFFSLCQNLRASSTTTTTKRTNHGNPSAAEDIRIIKPQFYVPKAERSQRNVYEMDSTVGDTRLARSHRTCPTRELNFLNEQWRRHKSPYRKFRHMANLFRAAPFQRLLFPDLLCVATMASGVTYYNEFVANTAAASSPLMDATVSMSPTAFAGATTAIGLLAGFRLNHSYGRYREARQFWGDASTALCDLARQTKMWMKYNQNNDNTQHHMKRMPTRMLKLCQAFPIALMFHLNDKGCHHDMKRTSKVGEAPFEDRVQVEFRAELCDVFDDYGEESLSDDFERLCLVKSHGGNVPQEVLICMAETIAAVDDNIVHPIYIREWENQVQRLCKALYSSERVLKTPLPTGFTRHSSRLLFLWSNCLPLALYPLVGPFGTLPTALLTSYAVLGIEDISVQLEEPFDILPLRQYSDGIIESITSIERGYKQSFTASSVDHGDGEVP